MCCWNRYVWVYFSFGKHSIKRWHSLLILLSYLGLYVQPSIHLPYVDYIKVIIYDMDMDSHRINYWFIWNSPSNNVFICRLRCTNLHLLAEMLVVSLNECVEHGKQCYMGRLMLHKRTVAKCSVWQLWPYVNLWRRVKPVRRATAFR